MKFFAGAILTIIVSPVAIWAGSTLIAHDRYIAKDSAEKKSTKELIIELHKDVREMRNHVMGLRIIKVIKK